MSEENAANVNSHGDDDTKNDISITKFIALANKQANDTFTSRKAFIIHKNARISTPFTENPT